jgi:hypothetical protein
MGGMITAEASYGAGTRNGLMAAVALRGPGALREGDVAGALIFDAGKNVAGADLLAQFYSEELYALDWLHDYVMNDELKTLQDDEIAFGVITEEEAEEIYNKADLTSIQSDGDWADS